MKVQIVLLGVLLCLAAPSRQTGELAVAGRQSQDAPRSKVAAVQQSLTGCIDEQFGQYILLDGQMMKIAGLQSAGSDNEIFAKYVGRRVQVRGTKSSGLKATFKVTGIEQLADNCAQLK